MAQKLKYDHSTSSTSFSKLPNDFIKCAIAAFRCLNSYSELATCLSITILRLPDKSRNVSSIECMGADKRLYKASQVTMAPALINGLRGMPFSNSSCVSELNAVPEGSLPTLLHSSSP